MYGSATSVAFRNHKTGQRWFVALWWTLILGLAVYYVYRFALRYFTFDPAVYRVHWEHAGWRFAHLVTGMVALFAGPLQFSTRVRQRYLKYHRWLGWLYLLSIAASAVLAAYTLRFPEHPLNFKFGVGGLALAWVSTSALAYAAIRRKQLAQHREWMIRSYVVTFGFIFFRIVLDGLTALNWGTSAERSAAASWSCWAVPLLVTELILQGRKIFAARSSAV